MADDVIISHKEEAARGIASNHGDPEHLWNQLGMNYTTNTFRAAMGGSAFKAVTLDQNNFCGMGVTAKGMKGNSFHTAQAGIRAQTQHLKAYANTDPLKNLCIDPRFKYVARGSAAYVEWLGQKENPNGKGWASGAGYGKKILTILKAILATKEPEKEEPEVWYNKIADMPGYAKATITKMVKGALLAEPEKPKMKTACPLIWTCPLT